ncbi:MAG: transglutaminase domain-containing protein [Planctomycetaceae bacterium]
MTVRVQGAGMQSYDPPEGKPRKGRKTLMQYVEIPGLSIELFQDDSGEIVLTQSPLLQSAMWTVSQADALKEIPEGVDLGHSALVKIDIAKKITIPEPLSGVHQSTAATFRLTVPSGLDAKTIPASDMQTVKQITPQQVEVTLRPLRPKSLAKKENNVPNPQDIDPSHRPDRKDAPELASSTYITSADAQVQKLAKEAAPIDASAVEIALGCERQVQQWVSRKTMSSNLATAAEVARSKEGDCTEHAVLLAAMLRARGVPARVAVGLVYWDRYQAFAGHAWTEAYIGDRWIPLDATLAQGGIGAGHIKLSDSTMADGAPNLLLSAMTTWRLLNDGTAELISISRQ